MARSQVTHTPEGPVARCKLLRDLKVGEDVIIDVEGIRTVRKTESREQRNTLEFSFMGAGVSSERRVELVVEQIAWELRQLRDQGGKVVVTAGPCCHSHWRKSTPSSFDSRRLCAGATRRECDRRS
jgi:Uncharacterized conserved protein